MKTIKNYMCPMRDGVKLATDLYLPDAEGAYQLILMRTPYDKNVFDSEPLYAHYTDYVEAGYVVAIQDCRGANASEGCLNLNGKNEHLDGYDAVEYLAAQPFCNGRVGMFGLSYFGFTQMAAAGQNPSHLDAICPFMTCSLATFGTSRMQTIAAFHLGWAYGQLLQHPEAYMPDEEFRSKMLPLLQENMGKLNEYNKLLPMNRNPAALLPGVPLLDDYIALVEGVEKKEFWDSILSPIDHDKIHTAALHGTGWLDVACNNTIDNFMASRRSADSFTRENARLLIGPWTHGGVLPHEIEGIDYGSENSGEAQDVAGMMLRWFNRNLKDMDDDCFAGRVRYFVMGSNDWHTAADWPPPEAVRTKFYLAANGTLQTELPQAGEVPMDYDPMNPAPSALVDHQKRGLTADWSMISDRPDVLEFRTAALDCDTTIAGNLRMTLFAATDVPDTDFACRVTDLAPDGYQRQIAAGLVRARHRNGLFTNDFLTPGETVCYEFGVGHAGYRVEAGHRIAIQLSGSLFPDCNRNLNTTEAPSLGEDYAVAHDRIFFGGNCASYIDLPILK